MTIQQQADLIVEKYRPYVHLCLPGNKEDEVETRNALLCGITEVEAVLKAIEYARTQVTIYSQGFEMYRQDKIAILNELKSRI